MRSFLIRQLDGRSKRWALSDHPQRPERATFDIQEAHLWTSIYLTI